ncbi:MAG TPA: hypothetical protein VGZ02_00350 [Candidatus Baltobacteraceae bacterium]|jgi:hypothetical protein|nr:hypothetical protein [Candidatus Baltobacteraceae bacterium]
MKLLLIAAIVLGAGMLLGTRRDTPFMRWGIAATLVGVMLIAASAIFTIRGVFFGAILAFVGVAVYYYGRIARREQLFFSKPK